MDIDALVNEIVRRVMERIAQLEGGQTTAPSPSAVAPSGGEITISKKAITERDIIAAKEANAQRILISEKAIVTDLAKEYASKQNMTFVRTALNPNGKGSSL